MTGINAPAVISWYRSPLAKQDFKELHNRSDLLGTLQSLGYLSVIAITGTATWWVGAQGLWWAILPLLFLHGTVCGFLINAVHELGHNTVFRTKALNALFVRIFSFLGWINFEHFNVSHTRHHRYTLHAPDDLEVVLPLKVLRKHFFQFGFINWKQPYWTIKDTIRIAGGHFRGEWEATLFPPGSPDRLPPMRWARTLLIGHSLVVLVSLYFHQWLIPILVTLPTAYGSWLHFLCNNTQHIGLQDDVPDFRLCCRTFTLNPVLQFLYWHMNFHIEHHMFAAVPCYRLGKLHRLIQEDLPPCPHGLVETWQEIAAIQKQQDTDPTFQFVAPLPTRSEVLSPVGS